MQKSLTAQPQKAKPVESDGFRISGNQLPNPPADQPQQYEHPNRIHPRARVSAREERAHPTFPLLQQCVPFALATVEHVRVHAGASVHVEPIAHGRHGTQRVTQTGVRYEGYFQPLPHALEKERG